MQFCSAYAYRCRLHCRESRMSKLSDSLQENTLLLIQKLSTPIEEVFDLSEPWNRERYERMINENK